MRFDQPAKGLQGTDTQMSVQVSSMTCARGDCEHKCICGQVRQPRCMLRSQWTNGQFA
ncbi:hypothetical protein LX32DRAFT_375388 [Colletotrichum zoysiae]|uniref:Uncharacterized protein n=1 Tax=Colletotrichum zoysiae TaxID=1216348 RepID=A0AAD9HHE4_9PEZI|nr:hypothetical protein LX32DRAFT_375388 [Colletotrichum zoysiae]